MLTDKSITSTDLTETSWNTCQYLQGLLTYLIHATSHSKVPARNLTIFGHLLGTRESKKGINGSKHLKSSSKGKVLEINCPRARYLSIILLKSPSLDYYIKRTEKSNARASTILFSMFMKSSRISDASHDTNTLATSPSSLMNPKRAQVRSVHTVSSFPHLPILLIQILPKLLIYTVHCLHASVMANLMALVLASSLLSSPAQNQGPALYTTP